MYVEESGTHNSQTLVLIHGGGVAGWSFEMQKHAFATYHCLIVDLPGHGQSTGTFSIDAATNGIIELIEARAHNASAILVGHSIGAKIALEVLLKRPELVYKAAICSAAYSSSALIRMLASKSANKMSLSMLKSPAVVRLQTKQFGFPTKEMEAAYINEVSHIKLETLLAVGCEMLNSCKIPDGLENIKVPVLIVTGEREVRDMKASAQELQKRLPQSSCAVIARAQHNYPWAQHAAFNKLLLDFIEA